MLAAIDLIQGLPVSDVQTRLSQGLRLSETGQRILAFYLTEMTDRRLHQASGHSSTASYAEDRLDLDRRRVAELVSVGRKLLQVPAIDRAFCEQQIGWAKLLLLVRVASPEHEPAWLERALAQTCRELAVEVRRSKPGSPPRKAGDQKGLPEVRFPLACSLSALTHQKFDLAKEKLAAELGHVVNDAECLDVLAELFLNLEADGSVPGRTRVSASLYRIVLRPDPTEPSDDERPLLMDSEVGPIAVDASLHCDAETDAEPKDVKTPPALRTKVLHRDGARCRCCGSRLRLMVHHIRFRAHGGRTKGWNLITLCTACHSLVHEGLLVLHGEREDQVRFRDREGNALQDAKRPVDPAALLRLALPQAGVASSHAPAVPAAHAVAVPDAVPGAVPDVDLDSLPAEVDGSWWRLHAHLIRFSRGRGLEFRSGTPASPEPDALPEPDAPRAGKTDAPDLAPSAFEGLVGQGARLQRLQNAVRGSRARGRSFPHTLFVGPPGTGKTTLARGVAAACGSCLRTASGPLLDDPQVLLRLLASLDPGDMLFVDEIHAVPRAVLETLYEAMAGGHVSLTLHAGARVHSMRLGLPRFTLLAATTEEGDLPAALQSRFGLREALDYYAPEELAALAQARATREGSRLEPDAALRLATHARGTPRETLRLLDRVLDDVAAENDSADTPLELDHVQGALARLGYDAEGLDPGEQRYLALLRGNQGPISLERLASMLGIGTRTLTHRIEPPLFRRGLVRMTARGRQAVHLPHLCGA